MIIHFLKRIIKIKNVFLPEIILFFHHLHYKIVLEHKARYHDGTRQRYMLHSDDQQGRRNEYSKLCVPIDMNETALYKDHCFVHWRCADHGKSGQPAFPCF